MKADDAIDAAKSAWKRPTGEPLVGDGHVILRHLWDALERLSGLDDTEAKQRIHDALCSGTLIARTLKNQMIIPSPTWKLADPRTHGWLTGEIMLEGDLPGYLGELPVVTRAQAVKWLKVFAPPPSVGRPLVKCAVAKIYREMYPDTHKALGLTWKEAAKAISDRYGESVHVSTIQRGLGLKK